MHLRHLPIATLALLLTTAPVVAAGLSYSCDGIAERARLTGFGAPVYQGDDGWFFRSNEIGHAWTMSGRSETFLRRLSAVLDHHGVRLVLMPLPTKSMLAPRHAVAAAEAENLVYDPAFSRRQFVAALAQLRRLDIPVVDVLAQTDKAEPDTAFFFEQDLHWRPELSRAAAQAAATEMAKVFPGEFPGSKTFVTRLRSEEPALHTTSSRTFLNQLCESTVPAEELLVYETVEEDQSLDAFLGDDSGVPPVSVIGTSFTDETKVYNFSGFLREALAADVASYSIAGGNIDQSLYKWAHTGQADSGTRALLWEIPYLDRMEAAATALERTVVPAIAGNCIGTGAAVFTTDYALDDSGAYSVELPPSVQAAGNDYYLAMTLSDPSARGFTLTWDYRDGKRDIFPVIRESRVGALPTVFAELTPELGGEVGSISIRAMQGGPNSGQLALCRYPAAMPKSAANGDPGSADFPTAGNEVTR